MITKQPDVDVILSSDGLGGATPNDLSTYATPNCEGDPSLRVFDPCVINKLQDVVDAINSGFSALQTALINKLDQQITIAQAQLVELQAINVDTDNLALIITELQAIKATVQAGDTNIVNAIDALQPKIDALITELQGIKVDTTAIETALGVVNTNLTAISTDITAIKNSVDEVEPLLTDIKNLNTSILGTIQNTILTDEEKCCYTVPSDPTKYSGWKRYIKNITGGIVAIEILDLLGNVVSGAEEVACTTLEKYEDTSCGVSVPAGFIPYRTDLNLVDYTPATAISNLYVHAVFETPTGSGFDVITGAVFTGATPGVLATDTVGIQKAFDACLLVGGYTVGQAIYTYDTSTNEVIVYQDPSLPVGYFDFWAGGSAGSGSYTNKSKMGTTPTGKGGNASLRVTMACDPSKKTSQLGFTTQNIVTATTTFVKDYINTSIVKSITIVSLGSTKKLQTGLLDASGNPFIGNLRQDVPYTWNQGTHFNGDISKFEIITDGDVEILWEQQ